MLVNGQKKVMLPELLVGLLLEMVTGSEYTPKGGLLKLVEAREAAENARVCEVREWARTRLHGM